MSNRVTIADVAREAGVSLMTVSRVINNRRGVSPATRQRVREVINRLGYRPSGVARGLATKRTGTLGLVMPDVSDPFFSDVARGAENIAYAEGYNVFLSNTEEDPERELALLQSLEEKRVDGVVICSSRLDDDRLEEATHRYPAVVLVNRYLEGKQVGTVLIDNELGGQRATQHLLRTGHQAIGFLAGPPRSHSGQGRAKGYRAAMDAIPLPTKPGWMQSCSPTLEGGYEATYALLHEHPELTALFCYNDLVAVGALQACADLGCAVPGELAIVGFDDIPLAALISPALTTCHVPRYELGSQAMRSLVNRIEGVVDDYQEIILKPTLIIRASAP